MLLMRASRRAFLFWRHNGAMRTAIVSAMRQELSAVLDEVGSQRAALTSPTSAAPPSSSRTTITLIAMVVMYVPKSETVEAIQNLT